MPRGCAANDFANSPRNNRDIECPSPQPGQKSKPRLDKGQIVKCPASGLINARVINPKNQIKASNGNFNNVFIFSLY
jgi:hypothetical protein